MSCSAGPFFRELILIAPPILLSSSVGSSSKVTNWVISLVALGRGSPSTPFKSGSSLGVEGVVVIAAVVKVSGCSSVKPANVLPAMSTTVPGRIANEYVVAGVRVIPWLMVMVAPSTDTLESVRGEMYATTSFALSKRAIALSSVSASRIFSLKFSTMFELVDTSTAPLAGVDDTRVGETKSNAEYVAPALVPAFPVPLLSANIVASDDEFRRRTEFATADRGFDGVVKFEL